MTKLNIMGAAVTLCQTQDSWYNKGTYIRKPVKWDKRRMGRAGLSPAQIRVTEAFAEISIYANDQGLNRWQRRNVIKQAMSGTHFGGIKKRAPIPAVTAAKYKSVIAHTIEIAKRLEVAPIAA